MAKWDVTTAEGLWSLEDFLMDQLGYTFEPGWVQGESFWVADDPSSGLPEEVESGWVYTPAGMVALKRWAAVHKGIVISSQVNEGGCGAYAEACWSDEFGSDDVTAGAENEPTAVALALARALEEMDSQAGGDGS